MPEEQKTGIEEQHQADPRQTQAGYFRILVLAPALGVMAGFGLFLLLLWRFGQRQFMVVASALLLSLICIWLFYVLTRRGRAATGGGFLLAGLLAAYAGVEFSLSGLSLVIAIGGGVLVLLAGVLALPRRFWVWGLSLGIFLSAIWSINQFEPSVRLPASQFPITQWYLLGVSGFLLVTLVGIALWQLSMVSLRTRLLIASILLVVIPLGILGAVATFVGSQAAHERAMIDLQSIISTRSLLIRDWMTDLNKNLSIEVERDRGVGHLLTLVQSAPGARNYEAAHEAQMRRFMDSLQLRGVFDELMILDRRGLVVLSSNRENVDRLLFNQEFFKTGLQEEYMGVMRTRSTIDPIEVIVSMPILDENGRAWGVIVGRAGTQHIRRVLISRENLGTTGEVYFVDTQKTLLTPLRFRESPPVGTTISTEAVSAGLTSSGTGVRTYENYLGYPVIGAFRWVPELDVLLIAEQQLSEINRQTSELTILNASLAVIMILLAITAALWVTQSISRPMMILDRTAQSIAAGNFDMRVPEDRKDEIGRLAISFNLMTAQLRNFITSLEERVQERTRAVERRSAQIATAAEVGSIVASLNQLDLLLSQVTYLISDRFGFYHAGIFLIDENGEYAVLKAANSEGGKRMLARHHKLQVGHTGIVGYVTANRQPRIALDVGQDKVFFNNPDLPDTRSEMALPLMTGGELLGALDVQSREAAAFTVEDIEVLQLVADQLAIAIQNARLFEQSEAALEEARRAYGKLSLQGWINRLEEEGELAFLSADQGLSMASKDWRAESLQAVKIGQPVHGNGDGQTLALPIKVRDTVIGVLDTYKPIENGPWTQEELVALETIIEQIGVALESARLYEETQFRAQAERMLGEVTSRMRETLDVDSVLKTAARQMLSALELAEVEIRLGKPNESQENQNAHL